MWFSSNELQILKYIFNNIIDFYQVWYFITIIISGLPQIGSRESGGEKEDYYYDFKVAKLILIIKLYNM